MKRLALVLLVGVVCVTLATAGGSAESAATAPRRIVMADVSWDSIMVHNRIVAFILEHGYGNYSVEFVPGETVPTVQGLQRGDIHIMMESWHENYQELYDSLMQRGAIVNLGANMPAAPQGWYVPRYMVEGDAARGIQPQAPDLRSVSDLPRYAQLFRDPENPDKGRILVGPPGWAATDLSQEIMERNGLYDSFTAFLPGSGTALAASMQGAYDRGQPWVGYYWEPTALIGRLDMILLPGSEFPPTSVDILVHRDVPEQFPEVAELLRAYNTSIPQNNALLAVMEDDGLDAAGAARWFLANEEATWTPWVSDEVAQRIRAALN